MTLGADTGRVAQATAAINALPPRSPIPRRWPGWTWLVVLTHPGNRTMPNPMPGNPGSRPR